MPELAADPRFRDNAGRMAHREELASIIAGRVRRRTTAEWLERLERAGVPAGPVLSIGEMLEHPQTRARGMVSDVTHTRVGKVPTLGFPVRLSETPAAIRRGAPLLGEHTRQVLRELGYEDEAISALEEKGVVRCAGGDTAP